MPGENEVAAQPNTEWHAPLPGWGQCSPWGPCLQNSKTSWGRKFLLLPYDMEEAVSKTEWGLKHTDLPVEPATGTQSLKSGPLTSRPVRSGCTSVI